MTEKYRKFDGMRFTLYGSFDTKWKAQAVAENMRHKARVRIIKVVSRAPPQGDVFFRVYYRMHDQGRK